MALTYALCNLDDVCEAFTYDESGGLMFHGHLMDEPTEEELEQLIDELK